MSIQLNTPINLGAIELPNSGSYFDFEGMVKLIVEKTEIKGAKDNQANQMVVLTLKCIEGEHAGKRATTNLNLFNSNPDAVRIAYAELAAYATAMGADPMLTNTAQLHGKPFMVYVTKTETTSKQDSTKTYINNKFSDWCYADGSPIVRGQFGVTAAQGQAQGGYAAPNAPAAPAAPAPTAPTSPVSVAPVSVPPVQQQQVQQQQVPPVQQQQVQSTAPQGYVADAAPQQQQQVQQQPPQGFAPPAGTAPFVAQA